MSLSIALFQMDIVWQNPEVNLRRAEEFVRDAEADLVVLPEEFSTGFSIELTPSAEDMEGQTVAWMRSVACRGGKAVAGSIPVWDEGRHYNRFIFAAPDGRLVTSDKRHLFRMGGENKYYTAGTERVVFEYGGFRILPLICYDLRFPVWSRYRQDYDLILCVASWPSSRRNAWITLLRARAIENQCYVAGVNRVGHDDSADYSGDSAIVDFMGYDIVAAGDGEQLLTARLKLEPLRRYRKRFAAWADADDFSLRG